MTLTTQTGAIRGKQLILPGEPDPDAIAVAWSVYEQVRPLQAYLFGSRARGNYDNHSDIDIAIITAEPVPEYLRLTIDRIAERAATTLHPGSPTTDVSFFTIGEFCSGRVKKNALANSVAKEGKLIMNGDAASRDAEFEEEAVNWDDVDARLRSAQEAVTDLQVLAADDRSSD